MALGLPLLLSAGAVDCTVGSVGHNVLLSMPRADSVKQAAVHNRGIAAERPKAFGCGPARSRRC